MNKTMSKPQEKDEVLLIINILSLFSHAPYISLAKRISCPSSLSQEVT